MKKFDFDERTVMIRRPMNHQAQRTSRVEPFLFLVHRKIQLLFVRNFLAKRNARFPIDLRLRKVSNDSVRVLEENHEFQLDFSCFYLITSQVQHVRQTVHRQIDNSVAIPSN